MSKLPQHIEESFDTLFNSLGYDHVDTCTCGFMEDCKCISGRDKLKSFIATILEEERGRVVKKIEKMMNEYRMRECPIKGRMSQCTKDMCFHWTPSWENIINLIKEE